MGESARQFKSIQSQSVRDRVSAAEWDMRCDLAAAYRLAAQYRWTDLIYTHFSARVPGAHHLLINPYGLMFDEVTASNLVVKRSCSRQSVTMGRWKKSEAHAFISAATCSATARNTGSS